MNNELVEALEAIEKERGISKEILIDAIETALISAYRRNYGGNQNVRVDFDRDSGSIKVFGYKTVVEEIEDEDAEILLEDAKAIDTRYEIGDEVSNEITPKTFGRIAAQMAKQVVVQRIREAERGIIFDEYIEKQSEVVTATVQRVERNCAYVELGRTEGMIIASEMMPGEVLHPSKRIKVYVLEVRKSPKGPQIMVSRTHPNLVKRLFELEVPELQDGVVQIKSIAREAGYRTKMAVFSNDSQVDPLGACVGQRGSRVERIVQELGGEKIDVIKWSPDPVEYIANALNPARVIMVQINEQDKAAKVIVPDSQLSLAIGKEGQNARLAAKLTGWKIDIKSQTQAQEMFEMFDGEDDDAEDGEYYDEGYDDDGMDYQVAGPESAFEEETFEEEADAEEYNDDDEA
ncbi:MAG: transcription termination factor NusA [Christensenellales bacterium]|jgi:N utilization substance protein A